MSKCESCDAHDSLTIAGRLHIRKTALRACLIGAGASVYVVIRQVRSHYGLDLSAALAGWVVMTLLLYVWFRTGLHSPHEKHRIRLWARAAAEWAIILVLAALAVRYIL